MDKNTSQHDQRYKLHLPQMTAISEPINPIYQWYKIHPVFLKQTQENKAYQELQLEADLR